MGIYAYLKNIMEAKGLEAQARVDVLRSATNALLRESSWSQWSDPDPDAGEWKSLGTFSKEYKTSWESATSDVDYLDKLRSRARHLVRFDGTARNIIRNYIKFVWKTGPAIKPKDDNPKCKEVWEEFCTSQNWDEFGKAVIRQLFRDGEVFTNDRGAKKAKRFELLPPELIRQPSNRLGDIYTHGIECEPDDVTVPVRYWYKDKPIPARDVIALKINCDANEKRGRTILEASLQDLIDYRKFRQNRTRLNILRTYLGIVQKVKGGAAAFNSILSKNKNLGGTSTYETDSRGQTAAREPGGPVWYTIKGDSDFETIAPNLQAADAQNDGRMILLAIAAGQGQSETWVTADAQNANYASQAVAESPAIVEMQTWQKFFTPFVQEIYKRVMETALLQGKIEAQYKQKTVVDGEEKEEVKPLSTSCDVIWPELIHREIDKEVAAYSTMKRDGVLSGRTYAGRLDLDFDAELENKLRDKDKVEGVADKPAFPDLSFQKQQGIDPKDKEQVKQKDDTESLKITVLERIKEAMHRITEIASI